MVPTISKSSTKLKLWLLKDLSFDFMTIID